MGADAQHPATTYDAAGNTVDSVDLAGTVTHYCYDALNRAVKTIQNPTVADPCADYTPSADADKDLINRTIYDANDNAIATIDPAGRVTRTYYDVLNRPTVTMQNLTNWDIANETWPSYDPAYPDQNIGSQTFYDAGAMLTARWIWRPISLIGHAMTRRGGRSAR